MADLDATSKQLLEQLDRIDVHVSPSCSPISTSSQDRRTPSDASFTLPPSSVVPDAVPTVSSSHFLQEITEGIPPGLSGEFAYNMYVSPERERCLRYCSRNSQTAYVVSQSFSLVGFKMILLEDWLFDPDLPWCFLYVTGSEKDMVECVSLRLFDNCKSNCFLCPPKSVDIAFSLQPTRHGFAHVASQSVGIVLDCTNWDRASEVKQFSLKRVDCDNMEMSSYSYLLPSPIPFADEVLNLLPLRSSLNENFSLPICVLRALEVFAGEPIPALTPTLLEQLLETATHFKRRMLQYEVVIPGEPVTDIESFLNSLRKLLKRCEAVSGEGWSPSVLRRLERKNTMTSALPWTSQQQAESSVAFLPSQADNVPVKTVTPPSPMSIDRSHSSIVFDEGGSDDVESELERLVGDSAGPGDGTDHPIGLGDPDESPLVEISDDSFDSDTGDSSYLEVSRADSKAGGVAVDGVEKGKELRGNEPNCSSAGVEAPVLGVSARSGGVETVCVDSDETGEHFENDTQDSKSDQGTRTVSKNIFPTTLVARPQPLVRDNENRIGLDGTNMEEEAAIFGQHKNAQGLINGEAEALITLASLRIPGLSSSDEDTPDVGSSIDTLQAASNPLDTTERLNSSESFEVPGNLKAIDDELGTLLLEKAASKRRRLQGRVHQLQFAVEEKTAHMSKLLSDYTRLESNYSRLKLEFEQLSEENQARLGQIDVLYNRLSRDFSLSSEMLQENSSSINTSVVRIKRMERKIQQFQRRHRMYFLYLLSMLATWILSIFSFIIVGVAFLYDGISRATRGTVQQGRALSEVTSATENRIRQYIRTTENRLAEIFETPEESKDDT